MTGDNDHVLIDLKHHPRVCSNCFRLRQHEDPLPERIQRLSKRTIWADAVQPERTRTKTASVEAPPGDTVSETAPRTVCECGSFSAFDTMRRSPDDPLDKATAIRYTQHLSRTLDALSVEAWERDDLRLARRFNHDRDVLFDCVRHLKSQPERQFKDDLIFAASAEVACENATHDEQVERRPVQHVDR